MDDKLSLKGAWSELRYSRFFKFCPNYIFVIGEAKHFKFRVLIDTEKYERMHDILLPEGCV